MFNSYDQNGHLMEPIIIKRKTFKKLQWDLDSKELAESVKQANESALKIISVSKSVTSSRYSKISHSSTNSGH